MEVAVTDIKQVQKLRPVVIDPLQLADSIDNGFDRRTVSPWRKLAYRWIGASGESEIHLSYHSMTRTSRSNWSRLNPYIYRADKNTFTLILSLLHLAPPNALLATSQTQSIGGVLGVNPPLHRDISLIVFVYLPPRMRKPVSVCAWDHHLLFPQPLCCLYEGIFWGGAIYKDNGGLYQHFPRNEEILGDQRDVCSRYLLVSR